MALHPISMSNKNNLRKICHVTSAHDRYDVRIFHKECCSLADAGFEVYLAVCDGKAGETLFDVKILSTGYKPKSRIKRFLFSNRKLKRLVKALNADLYHFHDPDLLGIANYFKRQGKKIIFDSHEDIPKQIMDKDWIPAIFRGRLAKLYEIYERKVVRKIDATIAVTPAAVDRLKKINHLSILITNYPIVVEDIKPCILSESRTLCYAGGINETWNHVNILDAIGDIPDVEYILAGKASDKYLDTLKQHGSWPKVDYKGYILHNKVKNIYRDSRIGIALNKSTQAGAEGILGNTKIFEFMAAGLPVICTNYRIWQEIVEENECGIAVDPSNVDEISNAISILLNDYQLCVQMGQNGREAVRNKYNWGTQEINLVKLYEILCK